MAAQDTFANHRLKLMNTASFRLSVKSPVRLLARACAGRVIALLLLLLIPPPASADSPMVEEEFLRVDSEQAGRTTRESGFRGGTNDAVIEHDDQGRPIRVQILDAKGRTRREITITYAAGGAPTTTMVEYIYPRKADGSKPEPVRQNEVVTTWDPKPAGIGGKPFIPRRRVTTEYHPTRRGPNGEPVPTGTKTEVWQDGHFVEAPKPKSPVSQVIRPIEHLAAVGDISVEVLGSGETIGTVATLKLKNRSGQPLKVTVPPLLLISSTGENQHYACPSPQTVTVPVKDDVSVPLNGVCLVRGKPPVPKGKAGDLIAQDAEGNPLNVGTGKIKPFETKTAAPLLKTAEAYYLASEKLQKQGAYKKMPYSEPKKQKEIAVQWGVWSDPAIGKATGSKPAGKPELAKTIYDQAEKAGPITPEKKAKLDEGINNVFEAIELTGAAAKDIAAQPPAAAPAG
jgi:hypothetical protein